MTEHSVLKQAVQEVRDKAKEFRTTWEDLTRAKSLEYAADVFEAALLKLEMQTYDYREAARLVGRDVRTLERWKREGILQPVEGENGVRFTLNSLLVAAGMESTDMIPVIASQAAKDAARQGTPGMRVKRMAKGKDAVSIAEEVPVADRVGGIKVGRTPKYPKLA